MSEVVLVGATIAVERAAEIAGALGAKLHIVSAYGAEAPVSLTDKMGEPEAVEAHRIAEAAANAVSGPKVDVSFEALLGRHPADALIEAAEEHHARMIVVGNRRVQGLSRVLGSVASAVANRASCDVLVVHTA